MSSSHMPHHSSASSVITDWTASALSAAIHARSVSCREVMRATLDRIDDVNPRFNAIVSRLDETELMHQALACDEQLAKGESMGWLHGIPQAIKDIAPTAGIASTQGSPLLKNFVPSEDGLMVQRMKAAGCIVLGKTNVPEFGLGSHTFNEVFGVTGNAYDPRKSAGGSSGGAAVALATRMMSVADGSDFMGSLRNPAAWNNVFGMRPSRGRVPMWPANDVWISQLSTEGPMGRSVQDVANLLAVQAGWDARVPLSISEGGEQFRANLNADMGGKRVGWLGDLGGHLAFEPGILEVNVQGLSRLQSRGCRVEEVSLEMPPDRIWECWLVWRRALVASRIAPFLLEPRNRALIKPEALWEHEQGSKLTGPELLNASVTRTTLYHQLLRLFERVDFLAIPSAQVWPFDVKTRWPTEIAGRTMDTYHRWMEVVILPTLAGLPSISVPAGFNAAGLAMGMQIIGRPNDDWGVLQLAHQYEEAAQEVLCIRPAVTS